ncbi:hypothetical protein NPIL_36891 [Nephila pilipes]|uniref:Uncharacterized protein n=1 Tax=Nephila pilipes TaxID=299642 RepID=A0A8X6NVE1_NEPPI|nr:hypothetical protein NPIL_36891 [Nephila pilipes]
MLDASTSLHVFERGTVTAERYGNRGIQLDGGGCSRAFKDDILKPFRSAMLKIGRGCYVVRRSSGKPTSFLNPIATPCA